MTVGIDGGSMATVKAILMSKDWDESLRQAQIDRDGKVSSPLRCLIKKMPEQAAIVLNRCITKTSNGDLSCNYEFIEDLNDVETWQRDIGKEKVEIAFC